MRRWVPRTRWASAFEIVVLPVPGWPASTINMTTSEIRVEADGVARHRDRGLVDLEAHGDELLRVALLVGVGHRLELAQLEAVEFDDVERQLVDRGAELEEFDHVGQRV